jgi:hypothetical protein
MPIAHLPMIELLLVLDEMLRIGEHERANSLGTTEATEWAIAALQARAVATIGLNSASTRANTQGATDAPDKTKRKNETRMLPVKRLRGEPGHTRDTRDTRTHKGTQTNLTTNQTHQQQTPRHPVQVLEVIVCYTWKQALSPLQNKFKFKFKFNPTASLQSTFDRLPLGCLLFMK